MEINIDLMEGRIQDLLCNALEGGSNYWYIIDHYNYPKGQTKESLGIEFPHIELPFKGGSIVIGDLEDNDAEKKVLDKEAIEFGMKKMAEKYPKHFADWLSEDDDAITADVWLQCCLFGEVVYG